jgi:hypothetical protein
MLDSDDNPDNWDIAGPQDVAHIDVNWDEVDEEHRPDDPDDPDHVLEYKWAHLRKPVFDEPTFEDVDYTPKAFQRLAEKFKDSGLQVIVKLASIELTPNKPEFPAGNWHVSCRVLICETALTL